MNDDISQAPSLIIFLKSFFSKLWNILQNRKILALGGFFILLGGLGVTLFLSQQKQNIAQHASGGSAPVDGQGVYDSCGTSCLGNLDLFSQSGFKLVLDYSIWNHTDIDHVISYANRANQDGIKIIWSFKDMWTDKWTNFSTYGGLTATCGCSDKLGLTQYLVNQVKNLPATWGYYVADEASWGDYDRVASVSNLIHQVDPNHPRFLVENDALSNGNAGSVYNLLPFFAPLAEVLGEDYYPVSYGQNLGATGAIASAIQNVANSKGKQSAMVLEVNSGIGGQSPSSSQMQSMLQQTIQNANTKIIMWYWYPGTSGSQWNNLATAVGSAAPLPGVPPNTSCSGSPAQNDPATDRDSPVIKGIADTSSIHGIGNYNWQTPQGPALGTWPQVLGNQSQALVGNDSYCVRTWCSNNITYANFSWTPGYTTWSENPPNSNYNVVYWVAGPDANSAASGSVPVSGNSTTIRIGLGSMYSGRYGVVKVANHWNEFGWPHTGFNVALCASPTTAPTSIPTPTPTPTPKPTAVPTPTPNTTIPVITNSPTATNTIAPTRQQPIPTISVTTHTQNSPILVGDINHDGKINIVDYNLLMSCFGNKFHTSSCLVGSAADLDNDGVVDGVDYNIWLRAFIQYNK